MTKRYGNKKHLNYILSHACIVSNSECIGLIQGHHLMKPFDGVRGMGLKANDKNLVPLCMFHHNELHRMGDEYKFSFKYFGLEPQMNTLPNLFG